MEIFDYVYETNKNCYGVIMKIFKKNADIYLLDTHQLIRVPIANLKPCPAKKISFSQLKKFARFEISYDTLTKDAIPQQNFYCQESYAMTLNDITSIFNQIKKNHYTIQEVYHLFYKPLTTELYELIEIPDCNHEAYYLYLYLKDQVEKWQCGLYEDDTIIDTDIIQTYKDHPWSLSEAGKESFISQIDLDHLNPDLIDETRNLLLEYKDSDNLAALFNLAYSYYGGNELFECDFDLSEKYLLKMLELDKLNEGGIANTLGYIYYYGRVAPYEPDYQKAFKYFSIGAMHGYFESLYKIADMYYHGKGCTKNIRQAKAIYTRLYNDNMKYFVNKKFDCKFADLAIRMANLAKDGYLPDDKDDDLPFEDYLHYYYLTIADFALQKRLEKNFYGDTGLYLSVQKQLDYYHKIYPIYEDEPYISMKLEGIESLLTPGWICDINIKIDHNDLIISCTRCIYQTVPSSKPALICYPTERFVTFDKSCTQTALDVSELNYESTDIYVDSYTSDIVNENGDDYCYYVFFNQNKPVLSFKSGGFLRDLKNNLYASPTKPVVKMVSVVFDGSDKTYDYLQNDVDCEVGDIVIVNANGKLKEVRVVGTYELVLNPNLQLKGIIKKKS